PVGPDHVQEEPRAAVGVPHQQVPVGVLDGEGAGAGEFGLGIGDADLGLAVLLGDLQGPHAAVVDHPHVPEPLVPLRGFACVPLTAGDQVVLDDRGVRQPADHRGGGAGELVGDPLGHVDVPVGLDPDVGPERVHLAGVERFGFPLRGGGPDERGGGEPGGHQHGGGGRDGDQGFGGEVGGPAAALFFRGHVRQVPAPAPRLPPGEGSSVTAAPSAAVARTASVVAATATAVGSAPVATAPTGPVAPASAGNGAPRTEDD